MKNRTVKLGYLTGYNMLRLPLKQRFREINENVKRFLVPSFALSTLSFLCNSVPPRFSLFIYVYGSMSSCIFLNMSKLCDKLKNHDCFSQPVSSLFLQSSCFPACERGRGVGIGGGGVREVKTRDRLNSFFLGGYRFSLSLQNQWANQILFLFLHCYSIRGTERRFPPKYNENTFQAAQSTFRSIQMHFNWRCKVWNCSVFLGQLQSFRNYKGFIIIFPKILDAI